MEHAENLEKRDRVGCAVCLRGRQRRNQRKGIVARGEQNGGERRRRNALLMSFQHTFQCADLREWLRRFVTGEFHTDGVNVRKLNKKKQKEITLRTPVFDCNVL